jgi:plastocyanin
MDAFKRSLSWILLGLFLTGGVALAGCTGYNTASGPQATSGENTVKIQNFVFIPSNLTVTRGTTVTWINEDTVNHQVMSDDPVLAAQGRSFSSPIIPKGGTYTVMFGTPGHYTYQCGLHTQMKGIITVL